MQAYRFGDTRHDLVRKILQNQVEATGDTSASYRHLDSEQDMWRKILRTTDGPEQARHLDTLNITLWKIYRNLGGERTPTPGDSDILWLRGIATQLEA
jgi:hypothetical protein